MYILQSMEILMFSLLGVAFFTLLERKLMGLIQNRKGPNKVGVMGFFQPFSDAMKLVSKGENLPSSSVKLMYFLSPSVFFFISLLFWMTYVSQWNFSSLKSSIVMILIFFSVSVYGMIFSGWFSSSMFALIGSVRAISQSISYEIGLTLSIAILMLYFSTLNISSFVEYKCNFILAFFPLFILMTMIFFAETSRSPFDLAEGESELVSGYSVEYGGLKYTVLFLAENLSILYSSFLLSVFFTKGSTVPFMSIVILFVVIRSSVPRLRFDKLMHLFWMESLPIVIGLASFFLQL